MSRKGNRLDDAVAENFFGLLKSELPSLQAFNFMEHFKLELVGWWDYHNCNKSAHEGKAKGLADCSAQTIGPFGRLDLFTFKYCQLFEGHFGVNRLSKNGPR